MFFATAIMLGAAVVSCEKTPSSKNGNKDNNGDDDTPTETIAIDGNFADWDACTTAVTATLPEGTKEKAELKAIKFTSDADYIYCYAEFGNHLKSFEGVDPKWDGNTWAGSGIPTNITFFIDTDANPKTGMVYREVGPFSKIGFEVACELYQFIAVETGQPTLAWSQCNYWDPTEEWAKDAEDGDEYLWPPYMWGTDNKGNRDNTLVVKGDYKAKVEGLTIKLECAISRDALYEVQGKDKVNISVLFFGWDGEPNTHKTELMGFLPQGGDNEYVTLNLK